MCKTKRWIRKISEQYFRTGKAVSAPPHGDDPLLSTTVQQHPLFSTFDVLCPNKLLLYSIVKLSKQGASLFGKLTLPITSRQWWRQSTRWGRRNGEQNRKHSYLRTPIFCSRLSLSTSWDWGERSRRRRRWRRKGRRRRRGSRRTNRCSWSGRSPRPPLA